MTNPNSKDGQFRNKFSLMHRNCYSQAQASQVNNTTIELFTSLVCILILEIRSLRGVEYAMPKICLFGTIIILDWLFLRSVRHRAISENKVEFEGNLHL